jgi:hypothetical protein
MRHRRKKCDEALQADSGFRFGAQVRGHFGFIMRKLASTWSEVF